MSRSLGARARARSRVVRGQLVHEVLVYRGAGPPTAHRFPSREIAERQARAFAAELDAGTLDAPSDWATMIDAFLAARAETTEASTRTTHRYRLQAVAAVFEGRDPLTLSATDATDYVRARRSDEVSPTTIGAELAAVATLQRWCVRRGWLRVSTWGDVERPRARRRESHLRPDEIGAFLRAAERLAAEPPGERLAEDWAAWPAAAWLLMHGLRSAEVQHLRVRDVDLVHGLVHVVDRVGARTKSRRSERAIPVLSERALDALRDLLRDRQGQPDAAAIPMGRGAREGAPGRSQWLARRCTLTCQEAGIVAVSPHALRHTVATLAITAGADVSSVQALLGHEDARVTTRIYSHAVAGVQARGAARAVGAYLDRAVASRPPLKAVR